MGVHEGFVLGPRKTYKKNTYVIYYSIFLSFEQILIPPAARVECCLIVDCTMKKYNPKRKAVVSPHHQ